MDGMLLNSERLGTSYELIASVEDITNILEAPKEKPQEDSLFHREPRRYDDYIVYYETLNENNIMVTSTITADDKNIDDLDEGLYKITKWDTLVNAETLFSEKQIIFKNSTYSPGSGYILNKISE